jgi:hypothetical protein
MSARRWRAAITTTALLFVGASGSCAHWTRKAERMARPALFVEAR